MKKSTRYVFSAALASVALGSLPAIPGGVKKAEGAVVTAAAFTFETPNSIFSSSGVGTQSTGTNSGTNSSTFSLFAASTGSSVGPLLADSGLGTAYGVHMFTASAGSTSPTSTVWSAPVGNGSQKSFSANHWGAGDYYEFDVPTVSLTGILVSFDQTSSATGPHQFALEYVIGGTPGTAGFITGGTTGTATFSSGTFASTAYSVGATGFSATPSTTAVSFGFNLASITDVENQSVVAFRLVDTDTATATGGTDRVDNFIVAGSSVPEPAGLALLTIASAAALLRRRKVN